MSQLLYVHYVYKLTDFDVRIQVFTRSRRGLLELLLEKFLFYCCFSVVSVVVVVVVTTTNNYKEVSLRV